MNIFFEKENDKSKFLETRVVIKNFTMFFTEMIMMVFLWMLFGNVVYAGTIPCITEWTIPTDTDGLSGESLDDGTIAGPATTIILPVQIGPELPTLPTQLSEGLNSPYAVSSVNSSEIMYTVDWGDGTVEEYGAVNFPIHTYHNFVETKYQIKVTGTIQLSFGYSGLTLPTATNTGKKFYSFTQYLTGLIQWGELETFSYGFSYCQNLLGEIPEPTQNTFKFTGDMGHLFYYCSNLTGTIPSSLFVNCSNVESFVSTFEGCSGLTGLIPVNLFSSCLSAIYFEATFKNCTGLQGIGSDLFTEGDALPSSGGIYEEYLFGHCADVVSFKSVFEGCTSFTEVTSNLFYGFRKLKTIESAFEGCTGLVSQPDLPTYPYYNVSLTNAKNLFKNCTGLSGKVSFAGGMTINGEIDLDCTGMFEGCTNITSAEVYTTIVSERMFYGCNKLTHIEIGSNVLAILPESFYATSPYSQTNPLLTVLKTTNDVGENYDWLYDNRAIGQITYPSFITEWTIPVNANGIDLGTTIKLPIESNIDNDFIVDWGDGTRNSYTTVDFPSHTYQNTTEMVYEIAITGIVKKFGYDGSEIPTMDNYNSYRKYLTGIKQWGEIMAEKYGFAYCQNLTGNIPEPTEKSFLYITNFNYTFYNCTNLTGNISETLFSNASQVDGFKYTFANCSELIGNIPEKLFYNNPNVLEFTYTFANCRKLTGNIPDNLFEFNLKVREFHGTFEGCSGLTGEVTEKLFASNIVMTQIPINMPGYKYYYTFERTFYNCVGLTAVNVNTVYCGTEMFYGCNNLTNITIGDNVQRIDTDAFEATFPYTATNLLVTNLITNNSVATNYEWASDNRMILNVSELVTEWTIPVDADGISGDTLDDGTIAASATTIKLPIPMATFNYYQVDWGDGTRETFDSTANFPTHTYTNTEETVYIIKIAGKVNSFGYYDNYNIPTITNSYKDYYTFTQYLTGLLQWGELEAMRYGFNFCTKLSSPIPEPTENSFKNVTSMMCLFNQCSNLSSIPNNLFANATNVTNFTSTFSSCINLSNIPAELFANTPKVTTFYATFFNCEKITGNIPVELFVNVPNVTDFGCTFCGCYSLTGIIPEKLFVNTQNVTSFNHTFGNCIGLTGGVLDINTDMVTNMDNMFNGCLNLKTLVFGKKVKKLIGKDMFINCNKLESIIMLYQVTEKDINIKDYEAIVTT